MEEIRREEEIRPEDNPELPEENLKEEGVPFPINISSLIVGLVVVIVLVLGGVFLFSRLNSNKQTKQNPKTATNTTIIPSPKSTFGQVLESTKDWKIYSDSTFTYNVKIPNDWETFKRVGDSNAYQIGVRPAGSQDVPITVGSQVNQTGETLSQWINSIYGENYPREKKEINGKEAVFIQVPPNNYNSYFVINKGNVYELSVSTTKEDYIKVFNQMLPTFQFTAK